MDSINTERSYTEYEVTEPTTDFAVGFDNYSGEDKDAIHVTLDGVNLDDLNYTVVRKNAQVIEVTPAIESGVVRIQRETYIDQAFHKFTAGALFSPKSVDENFEQIRHSQQEVNDGFTFLAENTNGVVQASKEATAQAKAATVEATTSAVRAESAADTAVQAVGSLQGVVDAATTATTNANNATATATTAASQASTATTLAQDATTSALAAQADADTAASNASAVSVDALAATGRANDAADVVADLVVGKVRAQDVTTSDGFTQDIKNTEFYNELNSLNSKTIHSYAAVADMVADVELEAGQIAKTSAYYINTSKGSNVYIIEPKDIQVEDGGSYIHLTNGLVAKGLFDSNTASIYQFGAQDDTDSTVSITNFFKFVRANSSNIKGEAYGDFHIVAPLDLDVSYTHIDYNLRLTTLNTSDYGVKFVHREAVSTGRVYLVSGSVGTGLDKYNARRQDRGILIVNARLGKMCNYHTYATKRTGIEILSNGENGNSNMSSVQGLHAQYAGSYAGLLTATPSSIVSTGVYTELSQRSLLSFAESIPDIRPADFILLGQTPYLVTAVDTTDNKVSVFPKFPDTVPSEISFLLGCGALVKGSDSNVIGIDVIDATACPIGAKLSSFYGGSIGRVHAGVLGTVGVAVMSSERNNSSSLGGSIGYLYTETLPIDILQTTIGAKAWSVTTSLRDPVAAISISTIVPLTIDTQSKSINDTVQFESLRLGGRGNTYGTYKLYDSLYLDDGDYILLTKKIAYGRTVRADIFGRGSPLSSTGVGQFNVSVAIAQTKGSSYSATLESVSNEPVSLCTVSYEGKFWFALDVTQVDRNIQFSFEGVGWEDIKSVSASTVSNITQISYPTNNIKSVGDLKLALDGKSLQLKSPNNTDYKITVTDEGVLTVTVV